MQSDSSPPPEPEKIARLPRFRSNPDTALTTWPELWCFPRDDAGPEWLYQRAVEANRREVCWCCGDRLGVYRCFVLEPIGAVKRVTTVPPMHHDCAHWLVASRVRETQDTATRLVWTARNYGVVIRRTDVVFKLDGLPTDVSWFHEGRPATYSEGMAAITAAAAVLMPAVLGAVVNIEKEGQDLTNAVMMLHTKLPKDNSGDAHAKAPDDAP